VGFALDQLFPRAGLAASSAAAGGPEVRDGRALLRGDDTGAAPTLVYLDPRRFALFSGWAGAAQTLGAAGLLRVDPLGCQFLLGHGLVPPPYTLYENVWHLTAGDRLEFALDRDEARLWTDFPYLEARSRQDLALDLDRLRALLAGAVARAVPAGEPALLMQSAGKDSTGLLLGLAHAGRRGVRAATYEPGFRESEASQARALAARFGVEHVTVPADPRAEFEAFTAFAAASPAVCADVALIPYLHVLRCLDWSGGVVLDGLGNDAYMGYVPARSARRLQALALARWWPALWGRFEAPDLGARTSYVFKTVQMYPAERLLSGSRPAPGVVRRLFPQQTPFPDYFRALDRAHRGRSAVDFRAVVRGRVYDAAGTLLKGRLAASWRGARAAFPYCDAELIEAWFHLPRVERYDARRGANKLPLRRLIEREIGPAAGYLVRKGSFRHDVRAFAEANATAIRADLARVAPLVPGAPAWGEFYLRRRGNYVHAYALTTLWMAAVWLARRPAAVVETLGDPRVAPVRAALAVAW